ncbi:MAG TPA: methyltransferase domain-containing protein [Chitinophagaceae bacterium]|nr:methyltransferase domain-containing protein [Chitinophagaceae bacterium]
MKWNNTLYDQKHGFISKYGEGLIEVLNPKEGEVVLDLGCGTGDLAGQIAESGCSVVGIDESEEMIEAARGKFPKQEFVVGDAKSLNLVKVNILEEELDAVFSNAVLHWIKEPEKVLWGVNRYLKKGGRFVAELGGKGNVEKIRDSIHEVLYKHGFKEQAAIQKWYFPSVAEYAALLEKHGFEIRLIGTYDRPTKLKDTENGIVEWLEMFAGTFFEGISENKKQALLYEMQATLRDELYQDGEWIADYKRLRFYAVKTNQLQ